MTRRREFLAQLGALAAASASITASATTLKAEEARVKVQPDDPAWDTSWLDRLADVKYRVVFNAGEVSEGDAMGYASTFMNHYNEVHGTTDAETRPVIVFRHLGTPMAFNDMLWEKYNLGHDLKLDDPATKSRAKRNIFWRAAPNAEKWEVAAAIETLQGRGLISLVCNFAVGFWSHEIAKHAHKDPKEVVAEVKANLIPGAILVPSGIYGLIRAQHAGCVYMPGVEKG